jgi:predicted Rossmann fold flavoprotein
LKGFDVIVIGGGAAGLMCAFTAGQRGCRVLVLERANRVGKKILMSGGGRCNFTNLYVDPAYFLSANPHFCISALSRYTQWDFIELVKKHRIAYHEKTRGQLFCDESSKQILNMLLRECDNAGVSIRTMCEISRIDADSGFRIITADGRFSAEALVVASGGLSIPKMGASGFGYEVARQFGLNVLPTRAGLVPFVITGSLHDLTETLAGIPVRVRAGTQGQFFQDYMLFTHRGLSGPAMLQLSSYWREGDAVEISLLPDVNTREVLLAAKRSRPGLLLRTLLAEYLPRKLVQTLETLWWQPAAETPLAEWQDKSLSAVADYLTHWIIRPAGTEGYRTAEVTLGGVDTRELSSKTMESKSHPGLYFIGEVVDVTGHLGGFNFQWAWSSGYVAGQYV